MVSFQPYAAASASQPEPMAKNGHAQAPDRLVGVPPVTPLVEQRQREDGREERGERRDAT